MKTLEHIEDYILGNLSAEEQKAFEEKLANDKELQEQVELQRILITEVQAFNAVQAAEAAYLEEQQEEIKIRASIISPNQKESFEENVAAFFVEEVEEKKSSSKVITWNFKRIASIAACLLICIGGYNVWLQQYTIGIGEDMYQMYSKTPARSRGEAEVTVFIKEGAYDAALEALNKELQEYDAVYLHNNPETLEVREFLLFQKANVYLLMGKRNQAKKILKELTIPQTQNLIDRLHWYSPIINNR